MAQQDVLRLVFWRIDLGARGPGYALQEVLRQGQSATAKSRVLAHLEPDILVLSGLDFDHDLHLLRAIRDMITDHGHEMRFSFAFASNAGLRTGLDMTGDGRNDTPDDTQGYGRYAGERALAILSRFPIDQPNARDFSGFLWKDLPGAQLPTLAPEARAIQRLSSTGHWDVPVILGPDKRLHLLIYQAGPPVFGTDGVKNLLRNHDETAFWSAFLDRRLPMPPPEAPIVVIGGSNLDPHDGDGRHDAMRTLLAHPALQDPMPASKGAALAATDPASAAHDGPHALDTVHWPDRPGNLRVSYILPAAELEIIRSGVFWPGPDTADAALLHPKDDLRTPHYPVWVDIDRGSVRATDQSN